MLIRTDTIHEDIVSALNTKIDEAVNSFECVIAEKKKECEDGNVPNVGLAYESFIRNIRKKAIFQFNGVKAWLGTHVLGTIIQQVRTSGIYKLHEAKEAITAVEAEKQKALEERKRIFETDYILPDFELYSLYGHPEFEQFTKRRFWNRRIKDASTPTKEIPPNVELAYQKYKVKKKRSLIIGLIITIICIIIDFSMIFTMFLSANYSTNSAFLIAIIIAAMLDAPPYVFGFIWTKNDDDRSLLELQGDTNTSDAKRKIKGNRMLLFVMLLVIILAFICYLTVRILSFMGGGDFNLAVHAIIEGDWNKVKNVEFSGADFLSIAVPITTSVVALAVGKMLYSLRTDYIKASVTAIKNEINNRIKACDEKIVDCDKQIKDLENHIDTLKGEIWTFYLGRKPVPPDDETFSLEISLAFQKLNLSLYEQTYCDCCLLIRNQALTLLRNVSDQFAQYAANQSSITDMNLSQEEEEHLDDFWVIPSQGIIQHQATQSHLTSIEKTVNEILNQLR